MDASTFGVVIEQLRKLDSLPAYRDNPFPDRFVQTLKDPILGAEARQLVQDLWPETRPNEDAPQDSLACQIRELLRAQDEEYDGLLASHSALRQRWYRAGNMENFWTATLRLFEPFMDDSLVPLAEQVVRRAAIIDRLTDPAVGRAEDTNAPASVRAEWRAGTPAAGELQLQSARFDTLVQLVAVERQCMEVSRGCMHHETMRSAMQDLERAFFAFSDRLADVYSASKEPPSRQARIEYKTALELRRASLELSECRLWHFMYVYNDGDSLCIPRHRSKELLDLAAHGTLTSRNFQEFRCADTRDFLGRVRDQYDEAERYLREVRVRLLRGQTVYRPWLVAFALQYGKKSTSSTTFVSEEERSFFALEEPTADAAADISQFDELQDDADMMRLQEEMDAGSDDEEDEEDDFDNEDDVGPPTAGVGEARSEADPDLDDASGEVGATSGRPANYDPNHIHARRAFREACESLYDRFNAICRSRGGRFAMLPLSVDFDMMTVIRLPPGQEWSDQPPRHGGAGFRTLDCVVVKMVRLSAGNTTTYRYADRPMFGLVLGDYRLKLRSTQAYNRPGAPCILLGPVLGAIDHESAMLIPSEVIETRINQEPVPHLRYDSQLLRQPYKGLNVKQLIRRIDDSTLYNFFETLFATKDAVTAYKQTSLVGGPWEWDLHEQYLTTVGEAQDTWLLSYEVDSLLDITSLPSGRENTKQFHIKWKTHGLTPECVNLSTFRRIRGALRALCNFRDSHDAETNRRCNVDAFIERLGPKKRPCQMAHTQRLEALYQRNAR